MGLTSSQNEYCSRGDKPIKGIECVEKVKDDIGLLIHNRSPSENLNTVITVLNRCRQQCFLRFGLRNR